MTGTTYEVNPWTPPYRVCAACEAAAPVRSDRLAAELLGTGRHGSIAACDRPDHHARRES